MRLRQAKGFLCGLSVAAVLVLMVLIMREPDLRHASASDAQLLFKAFSSNPVKSPKEPRYPVPPKPSEGANPPYPLPDELKPFNPVGDVDEGQHELQQQPQQQQQQQPQQQQQQQPSLYNSQAVFADNGLSRRQGKKLAYVSSFEAEKESLKVADELWNLIMSAKKTVTDNVEQMKLLQCVPKHHVFFGKVHKTGSSTVANILQRYGYTRNLNFVLPRKRVHSQSYNYISMAGQPVSKSKLIPPPVGQNYDMLWNHAIYNSRFYHSIMPEDTVFVSILRRPLDQFQSAFEYYGHIPGSYLYTILQMNVSNPLAVYLRNPTKFERAGAYTTYIRNKQSQDLGMGNEHVVNATLRQQYLHRLDKEFHLVMITELFDESLVMLRRLLCWGVKDVLYIPKNKNVFKKKRVFTDQDLAMHRSLNVADFDLYEFFLARFRNTMLQQGPDFAAEVSYFKSLLRKVQWYCQHVTGTMAPLTVEASQWSAAFTVGLDDCAMMLKHELPFLNDIIVDAIRKYQRSAVLNFVRNAVNP